jgi:hypothetical protein
MGGERIEIRWRNKSKTKSKKSCLFYNQQNHENTTSKEDSSTFLQKIREHAPQIKWDKGLCQLEAQSCKSGPWGTSSAGLISERFVDSKMERVTSAPEHPWFGSYLQLKFDCSEWGNDVILHMTSDGQQRIQRAVSRTKEQISSPFDSLPHPSLLPNLPSYIFVEVNCFNKTKQKCLHPTHSMIPKIPEYPSILYVMKLRWPYPSKYLAWPLLTWPVSFPMRLIPAVQNCRW